MVEPETLFKAYVELGIISSSYDEDLHQEVVEIKLPNGKVVKQYIDPKTFSTYVKSGKFLAELTPSPPAVNEIDLPELLVTIKRVTGLDAKANLGGGATRTSILVGETVDFHAGVLSVRLAPGMGGVWRANAVKRVTARHNTMNFAAGFSADETLVKVLQGAGYTEPVDCA